MFYFELVTCNFTVLSDFLNLAKNPFKSKDLLGSSGTITLWGQSLLLKGCHLLSINFTLNVVCLPGSVSSLSPLLQAAVLIVQQIKRGFGLAKSFYRACWEVYGRSQQLQINQKVKVLYLKNLIWKISWSITFHKARVWVPVSKEPKQGIDEDMVLLEIWNKQLKYSFKVSVRWWRRWIKRHWVIFCTS